MIVLVTIYLKLLILVTYFFSVSFHFSSPNKYRGQYFVYIFVPHQDHYHLRVSCISHSGPAVPQNFFFFLLYVCECVQNVCRCPGSQRRVLNPIDYSNRWLKY